MRRLGFSSALVTGSLIVLAALAVSPSPEVANQEVRYVVHLPELSDEDVARIDLHDTSVEDWLTVVGGPTLLATEFVVARGPSYDPVDLDYRVWLAWHDATSRIYCAVERVDDVYLNRFRPDPKAGAWSNPRFRGMWLQDSAVQLQVDGDHSGGLFTFMDSESLAEWQLISNSQAQFYIAISETFDAGPAVAVNSASGWFDRPPYADSGGGVFGERPTISVTEFYVTPFDRLVWNDPSGSVVSDLRANAVIGLIVSIADADDPQSVDAGTGQPIETVQSFPPAWGFYVDARFMADGVLLPHGTSTGEAEHRPPESWARIKSGVLPSRVEPIR